MKVYYLFIRDFKQAPDITNGTVIVYVINSQINQSYNVIYFGLLRILAPTIVY